MLLHDTLHLSNKLTPTRLWNGAKLLGSYYRSRITSQAQHTGLPVSIAIEPTTSCNLRCPECPSGLRSFTRPTGMLQEEVFTKVIDQLAPTLSYLTFYFQGEPFLHPKFLPLVNYAAQKKIYTATSTNAHYLNEETARKTVESGLDKLIVSIDGTTQDTYEAYRVGGRLDKVLEGTRHVLHWKKKLKSLTPRVVFQFLVVKPNEHQIPEIKRIAADIGVDDLVLKTAQIYDYQNGSPLIPSIDKYARYRKNPDGSYSLKNSLDNNCWKMWHSCVITWDGNVVPCCFDKDAKFVMGNVKDQPFAEIWRGERYEKFRQSLMRSRSEIEICKNCTEGTRVFA